MGLVSEHTPPYEAAWQNEKQADYRRARFIFHTHGWAFIGTWSHESDHHRLATAGTFACSRPGKGEVAIVEMASESPADGFDRDHLQVVFRAHAPNL